MLALQLAQNPQDVSGVVEMMREMREQEVDTRLKILEVALEGDALESYQMDSAMKAVLRDLVTMFRAGDPPELAQEAARAQLAEGPTESEESVDLSPATDSAEEVTPESSEDS